MSVKEKLGPSAGPWVATAGDCNRENAGTWGGVRCDGGEGYIIADVYCDGDDTLASEAPANARLMASAPRLYAALLNAIAFMGRTGANADTKHPLRPAWEDARAAVREADGK